MGEEPNYAQISIVELEDGGVQYDIIPHDPNIESSSVIVRPDGVISFRDEDGDYKIVGDTAKFFNVDPNGLSDPMALSASQSDQAFIDEANGLEIAIGFDYENKFFIHANKHGEERQQRLTAYPGMNIGYDSRVGVTGEDTAIEAQGQITPDGEPWIPPPEKFDI